LNSVDPERWKSLTNYQISSIIDGGD
jgi:hypothetical protein